MKITQQADYVSFSKEHPVFIWSPQEKYEHVMCPEDKKEENNFFIENEAAIAAMQAEIAAGKDVYIYIKEGFAGMNSGIFKKIMAPFIKNPELDIHAQLKPVFKELECQEKGLFSLAMNALFAEQQHAKESEAA